MPQPAQEASWLRLGDFDRTCRRSGQALDAVIAALNARTAAPGRATAPTAERASAARTEGWIALPTSHLSDLIRERRDWAASHRAPDGSSIER